MKVETNIQQKPKIKLQIQGGYALILMTNKKLIGVRDPFGIRPLVIGKVKDSYILASETCALDIVGAKFLREVENGEINKSSN